MLFVFHPSIFFLEFPPILKQSGKIFRLFLSDYFSDPSILTAFARVICTVTRLLSTDDLPGM